MNKAIYNQIKYVLLARFAGIEIERCNMSLDYDANQKQWYNKTLFASRSVREKENSPLLLGSIVCFVHWLLNNQSMTCHTT